MHWFAYLKMTPQCGISFKLTSLAKSCSLAKVGAAGEFSSPESTVCADSYFGICSAPAPPPPPHVTAVARKRSRSFCQKRRWQVTAKYTYTLRMRLCMKWHGAWLYGVHRMHQDVSSFMWHQPCQCCKYTTTVDIQKRTIKSWSLV